MKILLHQITNQATRFIYTFIKGKVKQGIMCMFQGEAYPYMRYNLHPQKLVQAYLHIKKSALHVGNVYIHLSKELDHKNDGNC